MAINFQGAGEHWQLFQEFGEQTHSFWIWGALQKSKKKTHLKGKAFISFDF